MFRKEIFDFFPEPGTSKAAGQGDPAGFADWAMDVFPRLLEGDVPFYSHEIDAYWNDIGNLEELREGNLDALTGAVEVEREGELVDGYRSGERMEGEPDLVGPVLLGPGCEIGDDVRIDGPVGDRRQRQGRRRRPPERGNRPPQRRDPRPLGPDQRHSRRPSVAGGGSGHPPPETVAQLGELQSFKRCFLSLRRRVSAPS